MVSACVYVIVCVYVCDGVCVMVCVMVCMGSGYRKYSQTMLPVAVCTCTGINSFMARWLFRGRRVR